MKKLLLLCMLVMAFLSANAQAPTIATGAISPLSYCPGSPVDVSFTATGTFNSGNEFVAQLSDATGDFSSGTNIGQISETNPGTYTINAIILVSAAPGTDYRIRVTSTNPGVSGSDNGQDLTIHSAPAVSVTYPFLCSGSTTTLTASGAASYTWSPNMLPLEAATGASLAVGLRRLDDDYTGNAIRLRRSTDNAEADFGFVGNDLDVASIATWLGAASGFAVTLYDQSGNGRDITQATPANQPTFVAAGMNGRPTLHFTNTQYMRNTTNFTAPFTVIYTARQTGPARGRMLSSVSNNWLLGWHGGQMRKAYFEGWVYDPPVAPNSNTYVYTGSSNGSTSQLYENGTLYASNGNGVTGPNGIQLNGSGLYGQQSEGDFSEVLIYGTVLSGSSRSAVESNMTSYYILPQNQFLASAGTAYTVIGTDVNGCSGSASTTPVLSSPGDPTEFGTNQWNVYAWNAGTASGGAGAWADNYAGFYTVSSLNLNTQNQWCNSCAPSDAAAYSGCPVGVDNHSWSAKRKGFPCGYYRIDIPSHDDIGQLWINGTKVWEHVACCDSHTGVWTGYLSKDDEVELRGAESGGGSHGNIAFVSLPFAISGPETLCAGAASLQLSVPATPSVDYLWSTGATTNTIDVTAPGNYSISYTDNTGNTGSGCSGNASLLVSAGNAPVFTSCPGNLTFTSCASVNYTAEASGSPAVAYTYTLTGATTGSGNGIGNTATFYVGTTTVTITATNVCGTATCSFTVTIPPASMLGDPAVFGNNEWLVYGFNAGDGSGGSGAWTDAYSGFYTASGINFNTQNQWASGASPSAATGYQGCPIRVDLHSWSAKRKGFPCGYYRIDIPSHDDRAQVFIDGVSVFNHSGCCDSHSSIWTGFLGANSEVEYRVSEQGSSSFGSITFTQVPVAVTGPYTLCAGATGNLTATTVANATYAWSTGQTTQSIAAATAGTYSVTITSPDGQCSVTANHKVTVNQVPMVANNSPVCSGNIVNLTASGVAPGGQGVGLTGSLSQYVITPNLTAATTTRDVTLEIWFKPTAPGVIVTELGQTTINSGWHDSQIEVVAGGQVRVRVWSLSYVPIGTVTFNTWNHAVVRYNSATSTLDGLLNGVPSSTVVSGGRSTPSGSPPYFSNLHYAIGATDGTHLGSGAYFTGEVDEFRFWNTVVSNDEINAWKNREVTSDHDNWANLVAYYKFNGDMSDSKNSYTAVPVNSPSFITPDYYTYTWFGPNSPTPSTSQVQTTGVLTTTDDYTVVASANGCDFLPSDPTTVTVLPVPSAQATYNGPVCEGESIQLTGTGGTTYTWSGPNGFSSFDQNPVIPNADPTMAGLYSITSSNNNGCSASQASVNVVVNANPTVSVGSNAPICSGNTLQLNASGGNNYSWTGPASFSSGQQNPTRANATAAMSGIYTVTVSNATTGCSTTGTTNATVNALPTVTFSGLSASYCPGASDVTLVGSPVGGSFTGSGIVGNTFSPSAAGTGSHQITYTYTDANTCTSSSSQTTHISSVPSVSISGLNSTYCTNSPDVVMAGSPSGGVFSGNGVSGNTFSPGSVGQGTYTITYTYDNGSGCTNSTSQQVIVNAAPVAIASTNSPICATGNLQLFASGGNGYVWSGPQSFASNQQNPVRNNATTTMSGIYTVIVSNTSTGCSSSATTTATVNAAPAIAASSSPSTITQGNSTNLAVSNPDVSFTYAWTGPGISPTAGTSVLVTPASTGTLAYTVTASNGACTTTATVTVTVQSSTGPCGSGLSGTYTLNPGSPTGGTNFQSVADIVSALETIGVCGPAVITFAPGTYTAIYLQGQIPGSSSTNTVTLNGGGLATLESCGGYGSSVITLDGTDNVVIEGFTLSAPCMYGRGIWLKNGTDNIIIRNNDITIPMYTSVANVGILAQNPGMLLIEGNDISGGRRGIQVENATGTVTIGGVNSGSGAADLLGNRVLEAYEYGIGVFNATGAMLSRNTVSMRSGNNNTAVHGRDLTNFTFDGNLIINAGRVGISLNSSATGTLVNNRVGLFQSIATQATGVYMANTTGVDVYHNSLWADAGSDYSYGMRLLSGTADMDVQNNIFASSSAVGAPLYGGKAAFSTLSHNNYYNSGGSNIAFLSKWYTQLANFPAQFSTAGSLTENPLFMSSTMDFTEVMSTTSSVLADVSSAAYLAVAAADFEGDGRVPTKISLGADEFALPLPRLASTPALDQEVYPNPFSSSLAVRLPVANAGNMKVTLTDLMGRQVLTQQFAVEAGVTSLELDVDQSIAQGVYLLQITQGDAVSTFRVVKQ